MQELIAPARRNPGRAVVCLAAAPAPDDLAAELLKFMAGSICARTMSRRLVSVRISSAAVSLSSFLSMATALPLYVMESCGRWRSARATRRRGCAGNPDHGKWSPWLSLDGVAFVPGAGRNAARDPRGLHRETMRILALPDVRKSSTTKASP